MTDDIVKRLRSMEVFLMECGISPVAHLAADRIELLEYALRSIADTPIGAEIPDRTTIWGLATYMQETAKDALKEGKYEQGT